MAPNEKSEKPVALDISTVAPTRKRIKIDGEFYELTHPQELGLRRAHRIMIQGKRIAKTLEGDTTDEEIDAVMEDLASVIREVVIEIPDGVLERLTIWHYNSILEVFTAGAEQVKTPKPPPPPSS